MAKKVAVSSVLVTADEEFRDDSHQAMMDWCEDVLERFLTSCICASLKNSKKDIAGFFIHGFIDYAYGYHLAKPFQYDASLIENMCLDILPRKMSTNAKDFKEVAPVLSAFFEWCETEGILKNTKALRNRLENIEKKIYEAAKNPANWGIAKSFFSGFLH